MQSFNPSSISFTDAAVSHFKNSLNGKPESFGIRIGVREAGCSGYEYFFEYTNEEQEGDIPASKFSFSNTKALQKQRSCYIIKNSARQFAEEHR